MHHLVCETGYKQPDLVAGKGMHLDRRAVDIERPAGHLLAAPLSPDATAGTFQHRLARKLDRDCGLSFSGT